MRGAPIRGPNAGISAQRVQWVNSPATIAPETPTSSLHDKTTALARAFVGFRDALSLPFLYLLLHFGLNVAYDARACPYEGGGFMALTILQLAFVVAKRLQSFFLDVAYPRLWWQLEILYAIYMYPWGTSVFILAKPTYYPGSVTNNPQCDLYHHPMALVMWIVAEITCSGAGLGLLLLALTWALKSASRRIRRVLGVIFVQIALAIGWNVLIVNAVGPWATSLL